MVQCRHLIIFFIDVISYQALLEFLLYIVSFEKSYRYQRKRGLYIVFIGGDICGLS